MAALQPPRAALHHRRCSSLPLTAATVVCRSRAGLDALHIAPAISGFVVDAAQRKQWTIELACERNDLRLLQRLVANEASETHPLYRSHVFSIALVHAVKHDSMELLECLRAYYPTGFASKGMEEAARMGKVHVLEWLVAGGSSFKIIWSQVFADEAAFAGHVDVLKWLKEHCPDADQYLASAIQKAAFGGHLAALQWLCENVKPDVRTESGDRSAMGNAIAAGHVHILEYFHEHERKISWLKETDIDCAMVDAHSLVMVKWLHAYGFDCSESSIYAAAGNGDIETVSWLLENNGPKACNFDLAIQKAAVNGHLEIAQQLHGSRPESYPNLLTNCYNEALSGAAANGHFDAVQWLFLHLRSSSFLQQAVEELAVSDAAGNGHLEIAQWIHSRRAEESARPQYSLSLAARNGRLDSLKWLLENSSEYRQPHDLRYAASNGHLDMLIWLHENARCSYYADAMDAAAQYNHLHVVKWMHENSDEGCTTKAMDFAAQNDHLHMVKWLHENRKEGCTTDAMDAAASIEMVEWLHANRTEGCTTAAMDNAADKGDFGTLLLLHENRSEGCTIQAAVNAHFKEHVDMFEWLYEAYPGVTKLEDIRELISTYHWYNPQYASSLLGKQ